MSKKQPTRNTQTGNQRTGNWRRRRIAALRHYCVRLSRRRKQFSVDLKERRVARTMAVIMVVFVVCWLPFFVIYVLFPFCGAGCSTAVGERTVTFIVWLGYVNSTAI